MILFKKGCYLSQYDKTTEMFFYYLQKVFDRFDETPTITSCNDGEHKKDSLHYKGRAWDVRTMNLKNPNVTFQHLQKELVGFDPHFRVIFENETGNTHFHVGYYRDGE